MEELAIEPKVKIIEPIKKTNVQSKMNLEHFAITFVKIVDQQRGQLWKLLIESNKLGQYQIWKNHCVLAYDSQLK